MEAERIVNNKKKVYDFDIPILPSRGKCWNGMNTQLATFSNTNMQVSSVHGTNALANMPFQTIKYKYRHFCNR